MRRWNGWGDEAVTYPVPPGAQRFLEAALGAGAPPRDVALADVVARVPPSRLPAHPLVSTDPEQRVRHALGQSLPDWIATRSGTLVAFPDGVAFPAGNEQVRELIRYARDTGTRIIPYGGGTSVLGHLAAPPGDPPVLSVDLGRMNTLLHLDETSHLATFGAGVRGPELERALGQRGFTLGHFPQSWEYSTLGGWVATRSAGQQSLGYGRIEDLFAGGRLESPAGTLVMPPFPASAAGPDLRQLVLGSEGRLGVFTEVTVRVTPLPAGESFPTVFFPDFECGMRAVREMAQTRLPLSMLRLSTAQETTTNLVLAGRERAIGLLERWLSMRGAGPGKCMLLMGLSGNRALLRQGRRLALEAARSHGGVPGVEAFGREWIRHRFRTPYLRNTLWEMGYAADTLETAATWSVIPGLLEAVEWALREGLAAIGERVYVFTHLSHVYPDGANIYTTYLYRLAADPTESLRRWQTLKGAASRAIVAGGGTISHQHGIGTDHRSYLEAEKGVLGMEVLRSVCRTLDPAGIMNPGKLL
ncbi:MAG: FAD-binding oxidoreductase [Bacillota bacterium]|nr:FAD-binding oxidoreductase [Bacillota bacterium]